MTEEGYYFGGDEAEIEFKTPVNTRRWNLGILMGEPPQPTQAGIAATVETFVPPKRRLKDKNGSLPRASDHCETTPVVRMRKILVCLL